MEIAEHIQTAILTPAPLHDEVQIAALMKPAEEVGGDYYDIIIDDNKRLWIAIGDVSGHGVTPGLIMLMAQSSFSTCVHEMGDISPKDAIISVNYLLYRNIRERLSEKHFMSMNFIKYLGNGEFVHAGAHLDIIVYRDKLKKCELIHTPGVYLGIKPDVTEHMINSYFKLEKDDIMLLYTDGVVEARKKDTKAKLYGVENLQNVLIKNYKKQLTEIIDAIIHETDEWTGAKQYDDITLVLVKKT